MIAEDVEATAAEINLDLKECILNKIQQIQETQGSRALGNSAYATSLDHLNIDCSHEIFCATIPRKFTIATLKRELYNSTMILSK